MSNRLDAVNACLKAIGEDPVSTITASYAEATKASSKVDEITKEVLAEGWHQNTDYDVELTPNVDDEIVVSDEWLSIDTVGSSSWIDVTIRKDPNDDIKKLYNLTEQSFEFTADSITVDIVVNIDIDDLEHQLFSYVKALAALRFAEDELGVADIDQRLIRAEQRAWGQLQSKEAELEDSNCLRDSPYMRSVTGRNNPLSGS